MAETRPNGLALALHRAQKVAERLTAATEAINERLREVQAALVRLRLGVRGIVDLVLPGDEPDWRRYLVFGKLNGDWLLFTESGTADGRDDWTITPLLNASRELRLAAVDVLPLLVQDMIDSAEAGVAESEAKAKALDEFLATIQQPGAGTFDGLSAHGIAVAVAPGTSYHIEEITSSQVNDSNPGLRVFGDSHPGMDSSRPADELVAIVRKRGQTKRTTPGSKGEK